MSGKEKLYFLLNRIEDARSIAPSGRPITLHLANDLNNRFTRIELTQLLDKLQLDEKVLRVVKIPNEILSDEFLDPYADVDDGGYYIEILPTFEAYFLKIQQEPEYQEFTGKKPQPAQAQNEILPQPNREALEKIWNVLQEIEEKRQLGNENSPIRLAYYPTPQNRNDDGQFETRKTVLEKLQSLEVITGLHKAVAGAYYYWSFKIGDSYQRVFKKYQEWYKEEGNDYQQSKSAEENKIKDPIYEIKYSEKTRKILINNFLLKQPRSFGDNEAIFAYLYKNPNQDKSVGEIKSGTGLSSIKDLNKFVENIGFTGELRKVFFKVSKNIVRFNNPVTKVDLTELGIEYLKLGHLPSTLSQSI